jgi:RHS repeat-associated protein
VQSTPEHYLSYVYDDSGNLISYTDSKISTAPVNTYTYDALNRLDTATNTQINKTLDYDYNQFGLLSRVTVKESGGATYSDCSYEYDSAGRLISMTEDPGRLSSFTYDNIGRLIGIAYPHGSNATISYEDAGWLQSIDYSKADNSTIETFQYNYNGVGALQSAIDTSGTTSYAYDNLSQVTAVTYPVGSNLVNETYTYDTVGNRLTSSAFSNWNYNADNQLVQFDSTNFTYDNNGNTLSKTKTGTSYVFQYDALNRLTETTVSGQNLKFFYDHLGRRIKKEVDGSATWFMYDGYRVIAEFDESGSLVRHYGYRPGSYAPHSITDDTGYYSVLYDRSGVPRRIIDSGEQVVYRGDYQSFGQMLFNDDVDGDGNSFTMNLRFAGQYFDVESGLHCNSNRFYDPQIGRFLSVDPVRGNIYKPGELNDYTYCSNSPLQYFDPNGLKKRKRPGFLARHFWDAVYREYYRQRLEVYTYVYFIQELFTNPVQNVKDAVTGKMGAGIQVFTVTTGAFGTITLIAFGGAWIAVHGGPALVFAKYSGTILSWLSLVTGYNIEQLMQNPQLIPGAVVMSEMKSTPDKDAVTIFSNVMSPPTDLPGAIDATNNFIKSGRGAVKFVGNTYDRAREALPDRSGELRPSPYERSQHAVTLRFLHH